MCVHYEEYGILLREEHDSQQLHPMGVYRAKEVLATHVLCKCHTELAKTEKSPLLNRSKDPHLISGLTWNKDKVQKQNPNGKNKSKKCKGDQNNYSHCFTS